MAQEQETIVAQAPATPTPAPAPTNTTPAPSGGFQFNTQGTTFSTNGPTMDRMQLNVADSPVLTTDSRVGVNLPITQVTGVPNTYRIDLSRVVAMGQNNGADIRSQADLQNFLNRNGITISGRNIDASNARIVYETNAEGRTTPYLETTIRPQNQTRVTANGAVTIPTQQVATPTTPSGSITVSAGVELNTSNGNISLANPAADGSGGNSISIQNNNGQGTIVNGRVGVRQAVSTENAITGASIGIPNNDLKPSVRQQLGIQQPQNQGTNRAVTQGR
jgi:hypothetical protein